MTDLLQRVLDRFPGAKKNGEGWKVRCPVHDDHTASLSIGEGEGGKVLFKCFGCGAGFEAIIQAPVISDLFPARRQSGEWAPEGFEFVAAYDYRDERGELLYQNVRYQNGSRKDFRMRRREGDRWNYKMGEARRVPYGLAGLLAAVLNGSLVLLVEGEKDVATAEQMGFFATTIAGGANAWKACYVPYFAGADLVIIADNDAPGRAFRKQVSLSLRDTAKRIRWVELPGVPEKGDLSDWQGSAEELRGLIEAAKDWAPPEGSKPAEPLIKRPEILTSVELWGREYKPTTWIVPGLIPSGRAGMVIGPSKVGKSWLVYQIADAVARGGVALGKTPVEQGRVLYLALEDEFPRMQSRLHRIVGEGEPTPMLHIATEWYRLDEGGDELLHGWLDEYPDCRLVIIDTWGHVSPRVDPRENMYTSDVRSMAHVKSIARAHDCAIVMVHHFNKLRNPEDWLNAVSGSNGLAATSDTNIGFFRDRGKPSATLKLAGRDIEDQEDQAIIWDDFAGPWVLCDKAHKFLTMPEFTEVASAIVDAGRPQSPAEIARFLSKSTATIKSRCYRYAEQRWLINVGIGYFDVSEMVRKISRFPEIDATDATRHGTGATAGATEVQLMQLDTEPGPFQSHSVAPSCMPVASPVASKSCLVASVASNVAPDVFTHDELICKLTAIDWPLTQIPEDAVVLEGERRWRAWLRAAPPAHLLAAKAALDARSQ